MTPRYLRGVTTLELDGTRCNGCRLCVTVCPHAVFALEEKRAAIVDRDACMECGACARNCEPQAITVRSGVGCANLMIKQALGRPDAECGCGGGGGGESSGGSGCGCG
ncbi:MAG TPA: mercury methylation ferredoxin HgcB [Polyangia bacterium]